MYLDDKRVFIAGGSGMAGTGVIRQLLKECPSTRIRASFFCSSGKAISHERLEYVQGDLRVKDDCVRMIKGCDCAVMAAASTGGAHMLTHEPWRQVGDNLIMNTRLLETFASVGIRRVVYIGSASLYQEFDGYIREDQLDLNQDPHPAYFGVGWAMRYIEKLCRFWHDQTGMQFVLARASNIYGPFARFDPMNSNVIPAIIRKAVAGQDPFEVWGSVDVARDVLFVDDFGRAVVAMLSADSIPFGIFNIGSGSPMTVGDIVQLSLEHAGHRPKEILYSEDRPVTIKFRALDCSQARDILGWRADCSLDEGIRKTTEWWIKNKEWWTK